MFIHLHVVRHGQTYFNRYNRLQGWSNSPLTQSGMEDADRAGKVLQDIDFAAAYCSDTTRAQVTADRILEINSLQGHPRPQLIADMRFREQFYGYFEGQDMSMSWWAAGAPHGVPSYRAIAEQYGLGATRDFLKEADPFHDAESDEEYWRRIEQGFQLIADNPKLSDGDHVLQISHGNTLLSLMHRFAPQGYDLSERPANGSVTTLGYDTQAAARGLDGAVSVIAYNQ